MKWALNRKKDAEKGRKSYWAIFSLTCKRERERVYVCNENDGVWIQDMAGRAKKRRSISSSNWHIIHDQGLMEIGGREKRGKAILCYTRKRVRKSFLPLSLFSCALFFPDDIHLIKFVSIAT